MNFSTCIDKPSRYFSSANIDANDSFFHNLVTRGDPCEHNAPLTTANCESSAGILHYYRQLIPEKHRQECLRYCDSRCGYCW